MSRAAVFRITDPQSTPSVVDLRQARTADLISAFREVALARCVDDGYRHTRLARIECELHARDARVRG